MITRERWVKAQNSERSHIAFDRSTAERNATVVIEQIFKDKLGDFGGKKIVVVGGGSYPEICFTPGVNGYSIDPLNDAYDSNHKAEFPNINWIASAFEDWETELIFDEVWFFNVLQHVIDPKACLEKAGKIASVVRVFEPVDTPTNIECPHSLGRDLFSECYGGLEVENFEGGSIPNFHGANCVYFSYNTGVVAPPTLKIVQQPDDVPPQEIETVVIEAEKPEVPAPAPKKPRRRRRTKKTTS